MDATTLQGQLTTTPDGLINGTARDTTRPGESLLVELKLGHGWSANIPTDAATGVFEVRPPAQAFPDGEPLDITATVDGLSLPGSGAQVGPPLPLELVAGDIVNNCNLRCPFCLTDYALTRGTKQMPAETYAHSLKLAPLVPESAFWLSCMHEPSLNASFGQFLDLVPAADRRRVSFTTNFAKKLDDDLLRTIAQSGAHSIRISIDSHDPELFGQLRKGARYPVFIDNLTRYAAIARETPTAPLLHIITMAFKDNLTEMPELVRWCHEEVGARFHEVRFMYYLPHVAEWGADHIMSLDEWEQLKRDLLALPMAHTLAFGEPEPDAHKKFQELPGIDTYEHVAAVFGGTVTTENYRRVDPLETGYAVPDEPLRLRLRWDGLIMAEQLPEDEFRLNVLHIEDPKYFYRLRAAAPLRADSPWKRV
ncbi:radical SAM protein [Synoicihabitans lomoniglobus]|uniref:Radical SAM protein n=1 Tax=Synoicihabitans lomoniglobus TaxID=2909285 RepID=A0AAE9ZZZ7_9BACT|nr:radical SAM protein [Opitutaceae bacterium LMO-M01]WED63862.1 radical SAM protein [Opitutaceae bacterium LMO-M01]